MRGVKIGESVVIVALVAELLVLILTPTYCFSTEKKTEFEDSMSDYGATIIQGQALEIIKDKYELVKSADGKGGIISYDVAENGDIATIYGDRDYLAVYDASMNVILNTTSHYKMRKVLLYENAIFIFSTDYHCAIYNMKGELQKLYELTEFSSDNPKSGIYTQYEELTNANKVVIGSSTYYITNKIEIIPEHLGDQKNQYRYLIRMDKNGNKTILLDKTEVFRNRILVVLYFVACAIITLLVLSYKYHVLEKLKGLD